MADHVERAPIAGLAGLAIASPSRKPATPHPHKTLGVSSPRYTLGLHPMADEFLDPANRKIAPVERSYHTKMFTRSAFAILQCEALLIACFVGLYFESWWSFLAVLLVGLALIWAPPTRRHTAIVFGVAAGALAFAMAFRTWSVGWSLLAGLAIGGIVTAINLTGIRHHDDVKAFDSFVELEQQRTGARP